MTILRYFGTDGIRGIFGKSPLTPKELVQLGWAIGMFLGQKGTVLIGKDTRLTGYLCESAIEAGLVAAGCNVCLSGPMPTPVVAYVTACNHFDAGIVVSASHNTYQYNGIKLFDANGFKLSVAQEHIIEKFFERGMHCMEAASIGKAFRFKKGMNQYKKFCFQSFPTPYRQTRNVVIDCAHGATYDLAPKIIAPYVQHLVVIGNQPNGTNINHLCGSEHPQHLIQAVQTVSLQTKLPYIGIAWDGDGDRVIMVSESGKVIDGDGLLYLLTAMKHRLGKTPVGVVGTIMSTMGLEDALQNMGCAFVRTQVGDKHILASLHQHGWTLGGEASGHILDLTHSTTGDGILIALKILHLLTHVDQTLDQLLQELPILPKVIHRFPTSSVTYMDHDLTAWQERANDLMGHHGRVVLRRSGTEAVIRLLVEGRKPEKVQKIAHIVQEWLGQASL
jgi:phosphoglucosamine mutase